MITMYDAANPANIPSSARVVGAYPMGEFAWPREAYARFADAIKVLIAVEFDAAGLWQHCNVADVERYALGPADARRFIEYRQSIHKPGNTVYCSASSLPAVQEACKGLAYWVWLADWTGQPEDIEQAAAVQYRGNVPPGYDLTAVFSQAWLEEVDAANKPWPLAA